jgi:biopolymer transport protein ExbB
MIEFFHQGGVGILSAIFGVSVLAWLLIIAKWLELSQEVSVDYAWAHAVVDRVSRGEEDSALALLDGRECAVGRAMRYGLKSMPSGLRFEKHCQPFLDAEAARLNHRLPLISAAAMVLPLLGLLGTVIGMIRTFAAIRELGQTDNALFAGGVSVALLTTEAGLVLALPVLVMHHALSTRAGRILEAAALFAREIFWHKKHKPLSAEETEKRKNRNLLPRIGTDEHG